MAIARARAEFGKETAAGGGDPGWLETGARARGSWATALLVEASPQGRSVIASAIGDSCLFLLEGFNLCCSFPLARVDSFTSTPALLAACPAGIPDPPFRRMRLSLGALRQPQLLLATDALAARLLAEEEDTEALFRFLYSASPRAFAEWAKEQTTLGLMARDDLSLLWVG